MLPRFFAVALLVQTVGATLAGAVPATKPGAGPSHAAFCARVGAFGCCRGETLLYCQGETARALDCSARRHCGWRETGRYDCDTAGGADPQGRYPRFCLVPDAGLPLNLDLGRRRAPKDSCGGIREEGCCFGDQLRYCENGALRQIDCRDNRFCGWRGVAQAYNCGTQGIADPRGKHPRACPGAPDAGAPRFADLLVPVPGPPARGCGGGCGCRLAGDAPVGSLPPCLLPCLLLALLWSLTRRRRCAAPCSCAKSDAPRASPRRPR